MCGINLVWRFSALAKQLVLYSIVFFFIIQLAHL